MPIYRRKAEPERGQPAWGQQSLLTITQLAALTEAQRLSRRTFKAPGTMWGFSKPLWASVSIQNARRQGRHCGRGPGVCSQSAGRAPRTAAGSTDRSDAPQPPQARRRRHHGSEKQSLALWTTVTQGQGGDIASPQSRLLGSRTENLAHLRPESQTGASPSLSASAAIFRGSLVCGPASGSAP